MTKIGPLTVSLNEPSKGHVLSKQNENNFTFYYPCETSSIECTPLKILFPQGSYYLQVIAASGGGCGGSEGGTGGVSRGVIHVTTPTTYYLYIGGVGTDFAETESSPGGYNGGGKSYGSSGGGGGATDFRKFIDDVESRILVAGGGGGGRFSSTLLVGGGNGGGYNGLQGTKFDSYTPCYGTQTSCIGQSGSKIIQGIKGKGANCATWGNGLGGGGGGGGYWGGGCAGDSTGSGGSGFCDQVAELPGYPKNTNPSDHVGNGYAIISAIHYFPYHCKHRLSIVYKYSPITNLVFISLFTSVLSNE